MRKYGMRYATIQHFQNTAQEHVYHYGRPEIFIGSLVQKIEHNRSAQEIGHAAIMAAAVNPTTRIQTFLRNHYTF